MADNMGQGKMPWYSHRLMHRKRVTCELHDSYFRLMTIKHAIPKILSRRLNYYITRWRQEVREFGDQTRWWQDAVEEACTQQSGTPSLRLSSPGERERDADSHKSGINILQFCSVSNSLSHATFQIKCDIFLKNCVARLHCLAVFIVSLSSAWICIWLYNKIILLLLYKYWFGIK